MEQHWMRPMMRLKVTCRRISYSLNTPIRRKYPMMRRHSGNYKKGNAESKFKSF